MKRPDESQEKQNRNRSLSLLLLLPLLCMVIFCASQFGLWVAPNTGVERQVNPNETADYAPWYDLVFAPVDDALLTRVAGEEEIVILGVVTAVPTVARDMEAIVGLPPTNTPAPRASAENNPQNVTEVAQVQETPVPNNGENANPNGQRPTEANSASNTPRPTNTAQATNTEAVTTTAVASSSPSATNTPRPSATTRPSSTARPSATTRPSNTPRPSATSVPSNTPAAAPNANFSASPLSGTAPLNVQFSNLSTGANAYNWNFGDGTSSTAISPAHLYNSAGTYTVTLLVSGAGGSDIVSATILVSLPPSPTATTVLDSDGDGVPNSSDACPSQGGIIRPNGCPRDTDNDGVVDNNDSCPTQGDLGFGLRPNGCPRSGPDTDGDGVRDAYDACPTQGGIVGANGCPLDTDGDGVVDNNDTCPTQGSIGFGVDANGCPIQDSDGDGIGDNLDGCPALGGIIDANGCPLDSDGDGVVDNNDACLTQGSIGFGVDGTGCPIQDTDGDGIGDNLDGCPALGGIIDANGCPLDSDGDGVVDNDDACLLLGGIVDANGCPSDTDGDGVVDNNDLCPTQGDAGNGIDADGCPIAAPSLSVSSLVLINTDTQAAIMTLSGSDTISLAAIGTSNIAIRAYLANCSSPCSVQFYVNGGFFRNENSSPYAIAGDTAGNLNDWAYSMGSQTIEAIPFTNPNGNGTQGTSLSVTLTINP